MPITDTAMETMLRTPGFRHVRANVRNFLYLATRDELLQELSLSKNDPMRAFCVRELLESCDEEK